MNNRWDYASAAMLIRLVANGALHNRQLTYAEIEDDTLKSDVGAYLRPADVIQFLEFAEAKKLAVVTRTPFARPRFALNLKEITTLVELQAQVPDSVIHQMRKLGYPWLIESLGNLWEQVEGNGTTNSENNAAPASDRVVRLDHNSNQLREVIVTVDNAIRAIEGLNEELDVETAQRVIEVVAGRKLLEGPQVDLMFVEALLVGGLRYLAAKTISISVDTAIKAALAAVLLYFGLS